jgi:ABC-type uncharacterized transport system involved in gliding motility auxiliary subunit
MVRTRATTGFEAALLCATLIGIEILSVRHYQRFDWTSGRTFALSAKSKEILRNLSRPIDVTVFMIPSGSNANELYRDVRELLERSRALTDRLRVEFVDIDRDPERLREAGRRYRISADDLASGVVVVASGEQAKYITREELADYEFRPEEPPRLRAWKGEQALLSAILTVTEERAPTLCFTTGHDEPALDSLEPTGGSELHEALSRDHYLVRTVDLLRESLTGCESLVLFGPERLFQQREVEELARMLEAGGRLLVLSSPTFNERLSRFVDLGFEETLDRWGLSLREDLVMDEPRLPGRTLAFIIEEDYSDHPLTRALMHHRTIWSEVREVRALTRPGLSTKPLVHTSDRGFATTDLRLVRGEILPLFNPNTDVKGPVPIAAAAERTEGTGKGAKIVVLGSATLGMNAQFGMGYNSDLLLSAVAWLVRTSNPVSLGPRQPEQLRLELDERQLARVFVLCVVGLPMLVLFFGVGVFWIRRT